MISNLLQNKIQRIEETRIKIGQQQQYAQERPSLTERRATVLYFAF